MQASSRSLGPVHCPRKNFRPVRWVVATPVTPQVPTETKDANERDAPNDNVVHGASLGLSVVTGCDHLLLLYTQKTDSSMDVSQILSL